MNKYPMRDFVRPHLLKELSWKLNNGIDTIDSYAIKWLPSEAQIKWKIKPSVKDYHKEFQNLINEGVVKVEVVFDGERNDDDWNGKFMIWKIIDIIKN